MPPIFDVYKRTDERQSDYSESRFSFLNRSAWPECGRMRDVIEQWFARYPAEHQSELAKRFRAKGSAYESAFFELCLHELLLRLGCGVIVYPHDIADGKATRPEFHVGPPSGREFLLEAILATNQTVEQRNAETRINKLLDEVNRMVNNPNFFITVDLSGSPKQQPSAKDLTRFVEACFASLDPDKLTSGYATVGNDAIPRWEYSEVLTI
jgi:hypothetical protein